MTVRLKAFRFIKKFAQNLKWLDLGTLEEIETEQSTLTNEEKEARRKVYEALKKSNEVFSKTYAFNTLIASSMEAMNALQTQNNPLIWAEGYYILSNILEPIIPHLSVGKSVRICLIKSTLINH